MSEGSQKGTATVRLDSVLIASAGILLGLALGLAAAAWAPGLSRSLPVSAGLLQLRAASSGADGRNAGGEEAVGVKASYTVKAHFQEFPMDDEEAFVAWMRKNRGEEERWLRARWALAQEYIESGELQGPAIQAFLATPREHFVRKANYENAYADTWMPVGWGATITDPDVVSMMTTTLDVKPDSKVLEIGTGSGYQSAILSHLTDYVYSIEIIEPLYRETNALYNELTPSYPNYSNIRRKLGDGFFGWEKYAPFDRIIVTCAIDHLPPPLIQQLNPGGIMVVPLGPPGRQNIMEVKKTVDDKGNVSLTRRDVYNGLGVRFIPFRSDSGQSYSGAAGE